MILIFNVWKGPFTGLKFFLFHYFQLPSSRLSIWFSKRALYAPLQKFSLHVHISVACFVLVYINQFDVIRSITFRWVCSLQYARRSSSILPTLSHHISSLNYRASKEYISIYSFPLPTGSSDFTVCVVKFSGLRSMSRLKYGNLSSYWTYYYDKRLKVVFVKFQLFPRFKATTLKHVIVFRIIF